ncbi:GSCFA domain-containing protein [Microvirga sp. STR05]|uniref:GSCFA domain-containing protein n=1 Tax=Hymenobacter duratus TaxID=2771356 RepID=A0ABR8JFF7_9BACT|nr:GSCFA domain-containing protein [Hymenobacter duratus]MBD2714807.1 GSCFA domain-containing protein [Hymenobacter duratus]MBR7949712.1 GSCFA domain-containing protein [Microvirga sp. STR05]
MFRTELPLVPHPYQLPLSARILTIGSCFSDSIGNRLAADKVHTLVNPFGTVFNPVLACRLLRAAAGEDMDWQQHLVEARGRWQSYDLHATVGADSPVDLLQQVQQLLRDTGVFLATADVVVLTLGTAWVHRLKETGELVSNCHKVAADKFDKELLTPDEIINAVAETHAYLRLRNPKLRFVLTVSPVRHMKDTLPLNAVSKSVLRVACHYLSELLPDVSYFPAYELLLDDLRDYRFYAEDMLHPSKVAEDYIWERFARIYFDAGFGRFRKEWEAIRLALQHRPLHLASPEHRQFLESTLEKLERLSAQADVRMEILDVRRQIESLPEPKQAAPELEDTEERIDIGEYAEPYPSAPVRAVAAEQKAEEAAEETEEYEEFESVSASAGIQDLASSAEAETAALLGEVAPAKKKRRSRGGAKRNKKKHAARLAAEAAASEAGDVVSVSVPAVDTGGQEAPAVLPEAPAVIISANSDLPLQTAMERRKRNSRRGGRGRRSADAQSEDQNGIAGSEPRPQEPEAAELQQLIPSEPQPAATDSSSAALPASEASEPTSGDESGQSRRPERTGRSASEKRAAALRKPHRTSSRTKPLYNNSDAPTSEEATASLAPPTPPIAEAVTVVAPVPATTPPATSVAPSIPDTKGTGASGQLSASGKATRADRPARPQSRPAAPVSMPAVASPAAPSEPVDAAPAKPASKPRRAAKPKDAAPDTAASAEAAATPAEPARPVRKSRAKPKAEAPVAPTPAVAAEPAKGRAPKSRKPTAIVPPSAEPAVETPPTSKRQRPPRRKPATPDTPSENG